MTGSSVVETPVLGTVILEPVKSVLCPSLVGKRRNGEFVHYGNWTEPGIVMHLCTGDGCENMTCHWRVKK